MPHRSPLSALDLNSGRGLAKIKSNSFLGLLRGAESILTFFGIFCIFGSEQFEVSLA